MPHEIPSEEHQRQRDPGSIASDDFGVGRLWTSFLIGLLALLIYNANLRAIPAGDTYPARYLPFAILQHHTLFLNPIANVIAQGRGEEGAYWMLHRPDGRIISLYPVITPIVVAPLYVPAVAYLDLRGRTDSALEHVARVMEKLSASFLAALSVSLLYLLLRRRATAKLALVLTIAYAFGTTTWVVSSQALWQHGIAEALIVGALLFLTGPCTVPRAIALGLLLGLIGGNRPPDVLLGAALGIYALWFWTDRRRAGWLIAAAALPLAMVLFYNLGVGGNVGGGYGVIGKAAFFSHPLLPGVAGLLVSPTRGLFIFSPFLLFLALLWRHLPRAREERILIFTMAIAIVLQIMLYAKADWRSGMSWGPRYMTDFLPFLMWMLVPVVAALRRAGQIVFGIAVGVAVVMEIIGAFWYVDTVDLPIYAFEKGPDKMRGAWVWWNAPYLSSLRNGLAPRDLLIEARGSFDGLEVGGRQVTAVAAGQEVVATGWALADSATPPQVAVSVDGKRTFATSAFTERPDVWAALHERSPSGWRIPIDTTGLTPGEHTLSVLVWVAPHGHERYLTERRLTVTAPGTIAPPSAAGEIGSGDLDESARQAAARIREHQQAAGYWLTAHTKVTRYRDPQPEMNTYLTALMIDLLDPLPDDAGLEESLQRARRHLTSQIEPGGLVRYHGLPDGPGIGTLGCAITPDTDDTALVWRLAPGSDRTQLDSALTTIERYRTREGLYRSWLAPREAYQCLDPGKDPNPADLTIQMHLFLLLAEVRPQAGRALCAAMRPLVDDDRVWAYYGRAPLVPMLRRADLRRAGCDLRLPESRMHTELPAQQIWVTLVRMLEGTKETPPDPILVRALLRELARDEFALIHRNPPLLYHNDVTASVTRYYWSEDAGYALWLRLHDQYAHLGDVDLGS